MLYTDKRVNSYSGNSSHLHYNSEAKRLFPFRKPCELWMMKLIKWVIYKQNVVLRCTIHSFPELTVSVGWVPTDNRSGSTFLQTLDFF